MPYLAIMFSMKAILKDNNKYILRFDSGDEVISGIENFAQEQGKKAGFFKGIGASNKAVLAYYNLDDKKYQDKSINERMEIVSLTGNVALFENKPIVHAHGILSDEKYNTIAGHVKKLVVSATCEVFLEALDSEIKRGYDENTGLNLMK